MTRGATVVVDLGFGDAGKGATVDLLAREGATAVVRFNGGGQAGHTVVTPDGRVHVFSQIGAGAFAGKITVLGSPFWLHPGALLVEAAHLARQGVLSPLEGVVVDERAGISSPFHQAAARLRELALGPDRHGSCGTGFGEAVRHALVAPDEALRAADLARPDRLRQLLGRQQERLGADLRGLLHGELGPEAQAEVALLEDPDAARRIVAGWSGLRGLRVAGPEALGALLGDRPVCEGAQGLLLDQDRGFHPHTTWSDTTPRAALAVLSDLGWEGPSEIIGVTRIYATRHGPGPFPTEDPRWALGDPTNRWGPWQGPVREGPLDAVLLRYALAAAPGVDGIAVTHLDRWPELPSPSFCARYEAFEGSPDGATLPVGAPGDLPFQEALGKRLRDVVPVLEALPDPEAALAWIEDQTGLPVVLTAEGPTASHRRRRRYRPGPRSE